VHFGDDRPLLPKNMDLPKLDDGSAAMPMFSREKAGHKTERASYPITRRYLSILAVLIVVSAAICSLAFHGSYVSTLGDRHFGRLIFFALALCIAVILCDSIQLGFVWYELRKLLVYLDRLPLRRTLRALKGLEWGSIWKLSGDVLGERYKVISLQLEAATHLRNELADWKAETDELAAKCALLDRLDILQERRVALAKWYVHLPLDAHNLLYLHKLQEELAFTAALLMRLIIRPAWQKEKASLIFRRSASSEDSSEDKEQKNKDEDTSCFPRQVQAAEEFFVLPYLAFIRNMLGRLRTIALGILWLFLGMTFAVSSYPFEPITVLGPIFLVVFVFVGGVLTLAYSQMSRDATLSHITDTTPGKLGFEFWTRLIAFGIGPLLGLLTTLFPSIADLAFSLVQPGAQALK